MRRLVGARIATSASNMVGWSRYAMRLLLAKRREFDHRALRGSGEIDLRLFTDPTIDEAWTSDSDALAGVLGKDIKPAEGYRALYTVVAALRPERVMLVSNDDGDATALYVARALKSHVAGGSLTVAGRQPVGAQELFASSRQNRNWAEATRDDPERPDYVDQAALLYMAETSEEFDAVILDGPQPSDVVYDEIAAALRLLRWGAFVLVTGYYPPVRTVTPGRAVAAGGSFSALQRVVRENPSLLVLPLVRLPPADDDQRDSGLAIVVKTDR